MKLQSKILCGICAAALAVTASNSAKAQTFTGSYSPGDWLLGVYDSADSNQYVIDLGAHDPTQSFTLLNSVSNIGTDLSLVSAFGSTWYSNTSLYFGVMADQPAGSEAEIFITNPNGTGFKEANGYGNEDSAIDNVGATISGQQQLSGQTSGGLIFPNNAANGWNGYGETVNGFETGSAGDGGIDNLVSDPLSFDAMQTNSSRTPAFGSVAGTFTIDSAGDVSYTAAAVPEPSTYAAIAMGIAVLAFARRRKLA